MATITIGLLSVDLGSDADNPLPLVRALDLETGRRFISLQYTGELSIYLPGYNAAAAAHARLLAERLLAAAEQIDPRVVAEDMVAPV